MNEDEFGDLRLSQIVNFVNHIGNSIFFIWRRMMGEVLIYIGTAFRKLTEPAKGSRAVFSTAVFVVKSSQDMPDISLSMSPERYLARVKLRALAEVLETEGTELHGRRVVAYVNDDTIEYAWSTGQAMDVIGQDDKVGNAKLRDIDLWKRLMLAVWHSGCFFSFGSGALLLGMCNEAASDYIRRLEV